MFEILHRGTSATGITQELFNSGKRPSLMILHIFPAKSSAQFSVNSQPERGSIINYRQVNVTANGDCRTLNSSVKCFSFKLFTKI